MKIQKYKRFSNLLQREPKCYYGAEKIKDKEPDDSFRLRRLSIATTKTRTFFFFFFWEMIHYARILFATGEQL